MKEINEQEHGAAIIFLNLCEGSVARHRITNLFENNRCYKIEDCLQSKQKAATCAEMDGALVFDVEKNRVSYAGLIVDGRVQNPGDMARGARHNSLATFYDDFCAFCKEKTRKNPSPFWSFPKMVDARLLVSRTNDRPIKRAGKKLFFKKSKKDCSNWCFCSIIDQYTFVFALARLGQS